jgi:SAM-dependent methyltransferase
MHAEAFRYVSLMLRLEPCPPGAHVVEIGGRNINGSVRELFTQLPEGHYLSTDILPGEGVDVVADGATLTVETPADIVLCCEVLEHAPDAGAIVANMARIARPGGRLIITAAGADSWWARLPHSAIDGCALQDGEHYANISPAALTYWLERAGCERIEVLTNPIAGDIYATARVSPATHA